MPMLGLRFFRSWLAALVVFTRLPVRMRLEEEDFVRALWQLPLLGWSYGALQALLLLLLPWPAGSPLSSFWLLFFPILCGGALHEDGLGDFSDAMLGTSERERRLEIMKDPRLGSFGLLALLGTLGAQYLSLMSIAVDRLIPALILSQVIARGLGVSLVASLPYLAREKSRAAAYLPKPGFSLGFGYALALSLAAFCFLPLSSLGVTLSLALALWIWQRFWVLGLRRAFGGYTGDCLGAMIKFSETLLLLFASWLWPRI